VKPRQLASLLHDLAVGFREAKAKAAGVQVAVEAEHVD
jgi:hypothetical protein